MSGRLPPIGRATGLVLVAALLVAPSARAQAAYVLERSSSRVMFQGRAFLRSIVGRSDDLVGMLSIRRGDLRSMRGNVRFPVASLETDPEMHPKELREAFGADVHPDIVFLVDSIDDSGPDDAWEFHGRLTMNGVTRPVLFRGEARITADRMIASGRADVDLHDWRIRTPRRLGGLIGMSSKIRLSFRAEFRPREDAHTALVAPDGPSRER
ncbi:MAG: YceI family protein [Gemmatimonadota bacterium]|nr:YceI family protein [Gemmatimonadota bacterium]